MAGYIAQARQDPQIDEAFRLARHWCQGHTIDGAPALAHALKVTNIIGRHCPDAPRHLITTCLLHDAPDLAPDRKEMRHLITQRCGRETLTLIEHLHEEHTVLDDPSPQRTGEHLRTLATTPWLPHAAVADKIVALDYMTGRADRAPDRNAFWAARPAFTQLIGYFHRIHHVTGPHIPRSMSDAYLQLLERCPTAEDADSSGTPAESTR